MASTPPPLNEIFQSGNVAVITGASTGIGKATSKHCAKLGMHTYMVDIDEPELQIAHNEIVQQTASSSSSATTKIEKVVCDVSHFKSVQQLASRIFQTHPTCHFLMNNAGTGLGGGALTSADVVQKVMGVNAYGPIHGCLAFVPRMKESNQVGLIVNTGSKQGITMPPGNLTYNMSKAALKTYTEGLGHELMKDRMEQNGKLHAALLVPGWVNTSIFLKAERDKALAANKPFDKEQIFFHEEKPASGAWMPSQVVEFMMEELRKGRFYIICPDNDVDRETDNLRMTWTMQDITEDRSPLSRWHPDWKDKFAAFLEENKKK